MIKRILLVLLFAIFVLSSHSADYKRIVPFILQSEGGWARMPNDPGGETNKGVTWATWKRYYGDTHARFLAMSPDDWGVIWKDGFWDKIYGDSIKDQNLAESMAEWAWMSGSQTPIKHLQKVMGLEQSGLMTWPLVSLINTETQYIALYGQFTQERFNYLATITLNNLKFKPFIRGWNNRMVKLLFWQYKMKNCD